MKKFASSLLFVALILSTIFLCSCSLGGPANNPPINNDEPVNPISPQDDIHKDHGDEGDGDNNEPTVIENKDEILRLLISQDRLMNADLSFGVENDSESNKEPLRYTTTNRPLRSFLSYIDETEGARNESVPEDVLLFKSDFFESAQGTTKLISENAKRIKDNVVGFIRVTDTLVDCGTYDYYLSYDESNNSVKVISIFKDTSNQDDEIQSYEEIYISYSESGKERIEYTSYEYVTEFDGNPFESTEKHYRFTHCIYVQDEIYFLECSNPVCNERSGDYYEVRLLNTYVVDGYWKGFNLFYNTDYYLWREEGEAVTAYGWPVDFYTETENGFYHSVDSIKAYLKDSNYELSGDDSLNIDYLLYDRSEDEYYLEIVNQRVSDEYFFILNNNLFKNPKDNKFDTPFEAQIALSLIEGWDKVIWGFNGYDTAQFYYGLNLTNGLEIEETSYYSLDHGLLLLKDSMYYSIDEDKYYMKEELDESNLVSLWVEYYKYSIQKDQAYLHIGPLKNSEVLFEIFDYFGFELVNFNTSKHLEELSLLFYNNDKYFNYLFKECTGFDYTVEGVQNAELSLTNRLTTYPDLNELKSELGEPISVEDMPLVNQVLSLIKLDNSFNKKLTVSSEGISLDGVNITVTNPLLQDDSKYGIGFGFSKDGSDVILDLYELVDCSNLSLSFSNGQNIDLPNNLCEGEFVLFAYLYKVVQDEKILSSSLYNVQVNSFEDFDFDLSEDETLGGYFKYNFYYKNNLCNVFVEFIDTLPPVIEIDSSVNYSVSEELITIELNHYITCENFLPLFKFNDNRDGVLISEQGKFLVNDEEYKIGRILNEEDVIVHEISDLRGNKTTTNFKVKYTDIDGPVIEFKEETSLNIEMDENSIIITSIEPLTVETIISELVVSDEFDQTLLNTLGIVYDNQDTPLNLTDTLLGEYYYLIKDSSDNVSILPFVVQQQPIKK